MNTPSARKTVLEMKIRAGDIDGAAKAFVENAKTDYEANGFRNAASALNENYQSLKTQAEAGPSRSVLSNEKGTDRSIATGQAIPATNAAAAYLKQIHQLETLDKILESKPSWLANVDIARERARLRSFFENARRELKNRGYNPDQL
jgi:hypothetical protein